MKSSILLFVATVIFSAASTAQLPAQPLPETWRAIFLDPPLGQTGQVVPIRIDEAGRVYGFVESSKNKPRGFLWLPVPSWGMSAGTHDLGPISQDNRVIVSVNKQGNFVGTTPTARTPSHSSIAHRAFVETFDRKLRWPNCAGIDALGCKESTLNGSGDINSRGQIVGWSENGESDGRKPIRGFVWSPPPRLPPQSFYQSRELAPLKGFANASARGLNDQGLIVGSSLSVTEPANLWYGANSDGAATLWINEQPTDLNLYLPQAQAGLTLRSASDINNSNQIVGIATTQDGIRRAVLLLPDAQGSVAVSAEDISTLGEIVAGDDQALDASNAVSISPSLSALLNKLLPIDQAIAPPVQEDGCWYFQLRETFGLERRTIHPRASCDPDYVETWEEFKKNPNQYHPEFNPNCYGCSGDIPENPSAPNGAKGWDASIIGYLPVANGRGPFWPFGGSGGRGANGDELNPHGGNGGQGGHSDPESSGMGGNGGDAGNGFALGDGGSGGRGGSSSASYKGGDGGNGGQGGELGGNGGSGADGGPGGERNGTGGRGGHGGNAGKAGIGNGGDGGRGGRGGGARQIVAGSGDGGAGGNGGNGSTLGAGGLGGAAGDGGNAGLFGGRGGDGGRGGNAGGNHTGGDGGRGGNGAHSGRGGNGGDGGLGGSTGARAGLGGRGGSGGNGGNASLPNANGGDGGAGGNGARTTGDVRPGLEARGGNGGNGGNALPGGSGQGGNGGRGGNSGNLSAYGSSGNGGVGGLGTPPGTSGSRGKP